MYITHSLWSSIDELNHDLRWHVNYCCCAKLQPHEGTNNTAIINRNMGSNETDLGTISEDSMSCYMFDNGEQFV